MSIFKKIRVKFEFLVLPIVAIGLFCHTNLTYAADFTGVYFGIDGGYQWGDANYRTVQITGYQYTNPTPQDRGTAGLYLGYGYLFNNKAYLGSELEVSHDTAEVDPWISVTDYTYKESIHSTLEGSVSLLPGYAVSKNILLYTRFGIGQNHYFDDSYIEGNHSQQTNAWATDYIVGAGVRYQITDHVRIKGEYDYSDSPRFNLYEVSRKINSLQPQISEVNLGIEYVLI